MAKKYVCIKRCYYRDRIWEPGATLASISDEEVIPKHFTPKELHKVKPEVVEEEAKTFSEMAKVEESFNKADFLK